MSEKEIEKMSKQHSPEVLGLGARMKRSAGYFFGTRNIRDELDERLRSAIRSKNKHGLTLKQWLSLAGVPSHEPEQRLAKYQVAWASGESPVEYLAARHERGLNPRTKHGRGKHHGRKKHHGKRDELAVGAKMHERIKKVIGKR